MCPKCVLLMNAKDVFFFFATRTCTVAPFNGIIRKPEQALLGLNKPSWSVLLHCALCAFVLSIAIQNQSWRELYTWMRRIQWSKLLNEGAQYLYIEGYFPKSFHLLWIFMNRDAHLVNLVEPTRRTNQLSPIHQSPRPQSSGIGTGVRPRHEEIALELWAFDARDLRAWMELITLSHQKRSKKSLVGWILWWDRTFG